MPTIGVLPGYVAAVRAYQNNAAAKRRTAQALAGNLAPTSSTLAQPGVQRVIQGGPTGGASKDYTTTPQDLVRPVPRGGNLNNPIYRAATLDEIYANPVYQLAKTRADTADLTSRNLLAGDINRLVGQSGYDITGSLANAGLGEFTGDVTEAARAEAASNPLSDRAQIETAYNRALSNAAYRANAMGTLGSGAQNAMINAAAQQAQLSRQDRINNVLDALRTGYGNLVNQRLANAQSVQDAMSQVAQMLAQIPQAVPGEAQDIPDTDEDQGTGPITVIPQGPDYAPVYTPTQAYLPTSDRRTAQIISATIGPKPRAIPKNIYQVARNVRMG